MKIRATPPYFPCRDQTKMTLPILRDKVVAVTGGGGYFGRQLGLRLASEYGVREVRLLDIKFPEVWPTAITEAIAVGHILVKKGDIRDKEYLQVSLRGAHIVFHVASFGMSGREQLQKDLIFAVNVGGTQNVIDACVHLSIPSLIYTSTFNVVFGGQTIEQGDETLPYFLPEKHVDTYSQTKTLADMKILGANGTKLEDGRVLRTVALRSAGIFGPGEERHIPRIIKMIRSGLFSITFGGLDTRQEFVYVDNLVEAHVLAATALETENDAVAGQAYFVSDGEPVNTFKFFEPLLQLFGYTFPSINLPLFLVLYFSFIIGFFYPYVAYIAALFGIHNIEPILLPAEVYKTAVTHTFNLAKIRQELGYKPKISSSEGMKLVVKYYQGSGLLGSKVVKVDEKVKKA